MTKLRCFITACVIVHASGGSEIASAQSTEITPFLRDVVAQNAPYIIAEMDMTWYQQPRGTIDHLIPVDFDGDLNGANNGTNSHSMSGLPSVYYSIAETGGGVSDGYYFIGYYFYHANDGGFPILGGLRNDHGHEHDMEGIFLVVKKTPYLPYGRPILALSEAHGALIPYYNPGWIDPEHTLSGGGSGSWGGKINSWYDPDIGGAPRAVAAVRSMDHGTYLAQGCDEPELDEYGGLVRNRPDPYVYSACIHTGTGLAVYQPAQYQFQVVQLPLNTASGLWRYQLLHVKESPLWIYRSFNPLLFSGTSIQIGPGDYAYDIFNPTDRYKSTANPPWAWQGGPGSFVYFMGNGGFYYNFTEDGTDNYHYSPGPWPTIPNGALLTDPGTAARLYFPGYSGFSEPLLFNAYLQPPAPCCQELSVGIGGPDGGTSGIASTWTAYVYGGSPPYTYQWSGVMGSGTGASFTRAPMASGNLYLDVWDAAGTHIAVSKWIEVSETCGGNAC